MVSRSPYGSCGKGLASRSYLAVMLLGATPLAGAESAASDPQHPASKFRSWVMAELPGSPEGLALGPDGALYATIPGKGEIVKLDEHGSYVHIATVPSADLAPVGRVWGADFGRDGSLFVTYLWHYSEAEEEDELHLGCRNSQDAYSGIYRVDVTTGAVTPFLTKRDGWPVCFPDDVAVDAGGSLYVTDLTLSGIWKIDPRKRTFVLWSADPLLQWPAAPLRTLPEGANDVVLSHDGKTLYVATDGYPAIVAIPILADGSAGKGKAIAHDLSPLDGIELDDSGNIYVSEILRDDILVFSPDGQRSAVVATSQVAPLKGPTSLVYRRGMLCTANLGWDVTPAPTTVVCMTGYPLPPAKK
jgi:sugar lactone lactonase YvrE